MRRVILRSSLTSCVRLAAVAAALTAGFLMRVTPAAAGFDTYLYVVNMIPPPEAPAVASMVMKARGAGRAKAAVGGGVAPQHGGAHGSVTIVRSDPLGLNNTVIKEIAVGKLPIDAAAAPDGSKVWVTNGEGDTVSEISTATDTVVSTFAVGAFPTGIVVSKDGTKLYVLNFVDNNVWVINAATHALIATIPVGVNPNLAALNPAGTRLYVTNLTSNDVSVINTATNTVVATVAVGNGANGVSVSPWGDFAYVTNINDNTVSIIRTFNNHVVKTIPSGGLNPNYVGFTLTGLTAFVTNGGTDDEPDNKIGVINPITQNLATTLTGGNGPAEAVPNPFGLVTYVPNFADDTVSVLRNIDRQIVATIPVGDFPVAVATVRK